MSSRRSKRRRKSARDPLNILGVSPGKTWDPQLRRGSLVFLLDERLNHVYEVLEFSPRLLAAHDLYNSPGLLAKGLKEGDEIPPFLVLKRKFDAPFYEETNIRKVYMKNTDASNVQLITEDLVASLLSNLYSVLDLVKEAGDFNGI